MPLIPDPEISTLLFDVDQATSAFFFAYFEAFSLCDLDYLSKCWAPDCHFRTRPGFADLHGREDIRRFYEQLWVQADERIAVHRLTQEADAVLAEIGTEIFARVDMPDFGEAGLASGERLKLHSIVAYRLRNDEIAHIHGRTVLSRTIEKPLGHNPAKPTESCHV